MKNNNYGVIALCIGIIIVGYFANIYKLCNNDFEAPYKEEAIRIVGICIPPVGIITGYLELNSKE
jgi:hypothetical protein|tara:strand:- start:174 stop:368 length:195 start_codon:yes stop_codon:yes gene_type:complete